MRVLLALGTFAELALFAGVITALVTDPDPFRLQVFHLWVFAILLALLNLRLLIVGARVARGGGFVTINDDGVTNVKDGIGPIAWREIRAAEIRDLPRVPRIGGRTCLFVDLTNGTSAAIAGSPPHQHDELERLRNEIRARLRDSAT